MDVRHSLVRTNGIDMHVAEAGERGRPIVLCHGFPELWWSWRHQIAPLAEAGWHVIVPDMRGYGGTDHPTAVAEYSVDKLSGDLTGLLDHYGYDAAVFSGHDWGSALVWQMPIMHPERVDAIANLSVPYVPRAGARPLDLMRMMFAENFFYIVYFQELGVADTELNTDPRRTIMSFLHSAAADGFVRMDLPKTATFFDWVPTRDEPPAWITRAELDVYVAAFERTGFTGGLNWYRNIDRNWEIAEAYEGRTIDCPVLFLAGERDGVIRWMSLDSMKDEVKNLRIEMIADCGHWTQQEKPAETTAAMLDWLTGLPS